MSIPSYRNVLFVDDENAIKVELSTNIIHQMIAEEKLGEAAEKAAHRFGATVAIQYA